jgi:hypothetical protein
MIPQIEHEKPEKIELDIPNLEIGHGRARILQIGHLGP